MTKQVKYWQQRHKESEEDYLMYKKNYEESQLKIMELEKRFRDITRERSTLNVQLEDLQSDKMRQRNEFIVLQAKATKMTNVLRKLASNISTYLSENKLLRHQLEKCEKRQHLGLHDMTPRPDYREIFRRREFKHFKEDFGIKILRQEYTTSEIIELVIDVAKAYESKIHFTGASLQSPDTLAYMKAGKDAKPKVLKKKLTRPSGKELLIQTEAPRASRAGSRRQIGVDASSKNTESTTPKSGRFLGQQASTLTTGNLKMRPQMGARKASRRVESSESSSSSLDSIASKLSDEDYRDIRTLEKGMDEINKDFKKLVDI